jgi:hypothetical protein
MNQRSILRVSAGTSASVSTEPRAATAERTICFPNWSKRVRIRASVGSKGQTRSRCGRHERHAAREHPRPRSLVSCRLKNISGTSLGVTGSRDKFSDGEGSALRRRDVFTRPGHHGDQGTTDRAPAETDTAHLDGGTLEPLRAADPQGVQACHAR